MPKNIDSKNFQILEESLLFMEDVKYSFNDYIEGNEHGDGTYKIRGIDDILRNNISLFHKQTLSNIIKASFKDESMGDSYEITIIVIEEAIRRKSIELQHTISGQFIKCQNYYDAGHRFFGSTVQDQLIDTFFKKFEEEALAHVLLNTNPQMFRTGSGGDDMAPLFYDYFHKATDEETINQVLDIFIQYILDDLKYTDESETTELLQQIKKIQTIPKVKNEMKDFSSFLELYL